MNALQKACGKTKLYLSRNSSTILTVIGTIGVVTTVVMAVKATPKAMKILDDAERFADKELTKVDKALMVAPVYIPTAVMGAATIACMFGANALNKNKQASLTSAYALLDSYHKQYRKTLIDLHGEEVDKEVRAEMARHNCSFHQIGIDVPDSKVIFYDEISGESFVRYEREVMDAEYHLNRNFALRGYASYNEFRMFMDLPPTDYGDEIGWSIDGGYSWIDFEHCLITRDDGGDDIYSINMIFPPDADYLDGWK